MTNRGRGLSARGNDVPVIAKLIWTAGFLIGATTHTLDIWNYGWLPYEFRPLPFNLYWTVLVFLDPLAALLIWVRQRWGIVLGCVIMGSNVLVNGYTAFIAGYEEFYFSLGLQAAFAGFVFFLAWRHWRSAKQLSDNS